MASVHGTRRSIEATVVGMDGAPASIRAGAARLYDLGNRYFRGYGAAFTDTQVSNSVAEMELPPVDAEQVPRWAMAVAPDEDNVAVLECSSGDERTVTWQSNFLFRTDVLPSSGAQTKLFVPDELWYWLRGMGPGPTQVVGTL